MFKYVEWESCENQLELKDDRIYRLYKKSTFMIFNREKYWQIWPVKIFNHEKYQ